ncbi:hypothetical protein TSUD_252940 [Trifolium subterraneum]|nr:hypothetical protein TSUD_252940 [Trifolium subterraneum]
MSEESEWHIFLGCRHVEQVWLEVRMWHANLDWFPRVENFKGLIFVVLGAETVQICQQFAMVLWCLWKRRNEKRSAGAAASVSGSVNRRNAADSRAERVLEAKTTTDIAVCGGAETEREEAGLSWCKLVAGELNCKVDAAIYEQCSYGIGMCIWNEKGEFVKAKLFLYDIMRIVNIYK